MFLVHFPKKRDVRCLITHQENARIPPKRLGNPSTLEVIPTDTKLNASLKANRTHVWKTQVTDRFVCSKTNSSRSGSGGSRFEIWVFWYL